MQDTPRLLLAVLRSYLSPKHEFNGMTGSEDADDDYESTDSPSSGSLTFSPKRTRGLRQRQVVDRTKGLGLIFEPLDPGLDTKKEEHAPSLVRSRLHQSSLLPLRLLAVIPSVWGIAVVADALVTGGLWHDLWPWGIDLSREALERLVQGGINPVGNWRSVSRGDMLLSVAWVSPFLTQII